MECVHGQAPALFHAMVVQQVGKRYPYRKSLYSTGTRQRPHLLWECGSANIAHLLYAIERPELESDTFCGLHDKHSPCATKAGYHLQCPRASTFLLRVPVCSPT